MTSRDRELLFALAACRWLATSQAGALSFDGISDRVLHRRLRLLRAAGYIASVRPHPMAEALHALAPQGRETLCALGWERPITLERVPPRNLEHFLGINDIRVAVERGARLDGFTIRFFYASWELQQRGWKFAVVPDAASSLAGTDRTVNVLFEYDRGFEGPGYVVGTKFRRYAEGLDGFPFDYVVTVGETEARLEQLREQARRDLGPDCDKFLFVLHGHVRTSWRVKDLLD